MPTKYCCKKFKEAKKSGDIGSFLGFHTKPWSDKFDIVLNECPYCNHHFQYQKGGKKMKRHLWFIVFIVLWAIFIAIAIKAILN
jgi:hypothetical protein